MRVLVVGYDKWKNYAAIWRVLEPLREQHGEALLVAHAGRDCDFDKILSALCNVSGIQQAVFPENPLAKKPLWDFRAALKVVQPDLVLAFHQFLPNSKRTKAKVEYCEKQGIPVQRVSM